MYFVNSINFLSKKCELLETNALALVFKDIVDNEYIPKINVAVQKQLCF